nr:Imm10 family immunity protein [uncultured Duganella sp.]
MNFELAAKLISFSEDEENLVFAFGDDEPSAARYLMLQHSLSPQEQEIQLGLDGLYIERDDQRHGCYVGVHAIRRIDNRIEIELTERGIQKLGVDRIIITPIPWVSVIDQGLSRLEALSQGKYAVDLQ